MHLIKMYLPSGGERELQMPIVPRVGEFIYFTDSEGLGDISEGQERRLRVTEVHWTGREIKFNESWQISIETVFDEIE